MPYYVIGNDKGLEEAYCAEDIDNMMEQKANTSQITAINNQITNINNNVNNKQKTIRSGTAAPSGGSNGDIYIQY